MPEVHDKGAPSTSTSSQCAHGLVGWPWPRTCSTRRDCACRSPWPHCVAMQVMWGAWHHSRRGIRLQGEESGCSKNQANQWGSDEGSCLPDISSRLPVNWDHFSDMHKPQSLYVPIEFSQMLAPFRAHAGLNQQSKQLEFEDGALFSAKISRLRHAGLRFPLSRASFAMQAKSRPGS